MSFLDGSMRVHSRRHIDRIDSDTFVQRIERPSIRVLSKGSIGMTLIDIHTVCLSPREVMAVRLLCIRVEAVSLHAYITIIVIQQAPGAQSNLAFQLGQIRIAEAGAVLLFQCLLHWPVYAHAAMPF